MVVEELKTVALLDEVAVGIVGKCDAILCGSSSGRVIREDVAVECGKLSATSSSCCLTSVSGRIADDIIPKHFGGYRFVIILCNRKQLKNQTAEAVWQNYIFLQMEWYMKSISSLEM